MVVEAKSTLDDRSTIVSTVKAPPPISPSPLTAASSVETLELLSKKPEIISEPAKAIVREAVNEVDNVPTIEHSSLPSTPDDNAASDHSDLEDRFRFLVDEARAEEAVNQECVVDLAVNMASTEDQEKEIQVETEPAAYDDSIYVSEEDIDPEVLERLKKDRKFYDEWKARGRVPSLLSPNSTKQSERRMRHTEL